MIAIAHILAKGLVLFLLPCGALGVCPMCSFAFSAGVGLAQYFGVDDTITGVWLGGLTVSLMVMTDQWIQSRVKTALTRRLFRVANSILYGLSLLLPMWMWGIVGNPFNRLWGIDKLILGVISGGSILIASQQLYLVLKRCNHDRPHFPYQKVVMSVVALLVLNGLFYAIQ